MPLHFGADEDSCSQMLAVQACTLGATTFGELRLDGSVRRLALLSVFGAGTSIAAPSCEPGADGDDGVSCRLPYHWVGGRQYGVITRTCGCTT